MVPKKAFALGLAALAVFVFACSPARAAGEVGIVDPRKVLFQHPEFGVVAKHIAELNRQKENELRFALEKETDPDRRVRILEAVHHEIAGAEDRLMSPLREDCQHALAVVMEKEHIVIVLKADVVYCGGVDITEDVIAQLKKISKK